LRDPFLRFWFRFVFPFQDDLEAGLSSSTLFDTEIEPTLNEHVGRQFEDFCLSWTRRNYPITKASSWWGNSLNEFRKNGSRSTEEIDIVGMARGRVIVIGEVRWRNSMMDISYLNEIQKYKIPALKQSKLKLSANPTILLFCLGGYTKELQSQASKRTDLVLVDVRKALSS